jgi:hypothetical protein
LGRKRAFDGSIARRIFDTIGKLHAYQETCRELNTTSCLWSKPPIAFIHLVMWSQTPCNAHLRLFPPLKLFKESYHVVATFSPSSSLKLHHSNQLSANLLPVHSMQNLPLRALLIQNTMTTLFATNRIALLQRDFGVAVTAQVVHRRTAIECIASESVAARRGSRSGDLVGFPR